MIKKKHLNRHLQTSKYRPFEERTKNILLSKFFNDNIIPLMVILVKKEAAGTFIICDFLDSCHKMSAVNKCSKDLLKSVGRSGMVSFEISPH